MTPFAKKLNLRVKYMIPAVRTTHFNDLLGRETLVKRDGLGVLFGYGVVTRGCLKVIR
jgi:hypothetical protein